MFEFLNHPFLNEGMFCYMIKKREKQHENTDVEVTLSQETDTY